MKVLLRISSLLIFLFLLSCTENENYWVSDNPLDSLGSNWFPPTASVSPKVASVRTGESVNFTATADDENGTVVKYHWYSLKTQEKIVGTTAVQTIPFTVHGIDTVTLCVEDNHGILSPMDTTIVTVKNDEPYLVTPVDKEVIATLNSALYWSTGFFDAGITLKMDTIFPPTTVVAENLTGNSYALSHNRYSQRYYWQCVAFNDTGASASSEIYSYTTPDIPTPVLTATTQSTSAIQLEWGAIPFATAYILEMSSSENGTYSEIYTGTANTYVHTGLDKASTRYYRVKAVQDLHISLWSDVQNSTTKAQGEWKTLTGSMATPRSGIVFGGVNNKLYVIGGDGTENLVEEYDITLNRWTSKSSMPSGRNRGGVVVYNEKIYVIGGRNSSDISVNSVEVYDPAKNTWESLSSMPTARRSFACAEVDGKIYAIGGYSTGYNCKKVEVYDIATNKWEKLADKSVGIDFCPAAAVDGIIYIITDISGEACEAFDTKTGEWSTRNHMITNRISTDISLASLNGVVYGYNRGTLERYDINQDEWFIEKTTGKDDEPFIGTCDGKLYMVGYETGVVEYTP